MRVEQVSVFLQWGQISFIILLVYIKCQSVALGLVMVCASALGVQNTAQLVLHAEACPILLVCKPHIEDAIKISVFELSGGFGNHGLNAWKPKLTTVLYA